jgi:hypothetical protein
MSDERLAVCDGGRPSRPRGAVARGRTAAVIGTLLALVLLSVAISPAARADEYESEREAALSLGLEAYEYGLPLLDSERIYKSITSVTVPTDSGAAPVNQFSHFQTLVTEREGCVVAPNDDTLYSIAELKLNAQPIVMHVPETDRFSVAELLSPYTENFALIGQYGSGFLPPGNYVIAGPSELEGQDETQGMKIVHSPYDRVWVIGRTYVGDEADLPAARATEEARKLVPLSKWAKRGLAYEPHTPANVVTTPTCGTIPGTTLGKSTLPFWKALGKALVRFPPPEADAPLLARLAAVHIGPGMAPSKSDDSPATLRGLAEAVQTGPGRVLSDARELLTAGFAAHNGWLVGNVGHYGADYRLRAVVDKLGVGAPTPNQAIYPLALTDRNGAALEGAATRYVAHFPASDFPMPVTGFWSLTMYDSEGLFVTNSLNRYSLGGSSALKFNADGSLDVYLQSSEPASEAQRGNWLPAPAGPFHLILRLYGPDEEAIPQILAGGSEGWQPPTILPCLSNGKTATGWACAE